MSKFVSALTCVLLLTLAGCKGYVSTTPGTSVEVNGKVVGPDGSPITPAMITFQPTGGNAQPNEFPIGTDGSFSGKLVSGKYTYYISPAVGALANKSAAALKALPETYTKATLERQVEVTGGAIALKF